MSDLVQKVVFMIVPIFTAWLFSHVLENLEVFKKLSKQSKSLLWLVVSALIGAVIYQLLAAATPETIAQLTAGLAILTQIVTTYLSGTFYNMATAKDNSVQVGAG